MEYWKYKAIDKLRDYPLQRESVHNLKQEIERLESDAVSIRSVRADATPVRGGGSGREDKLLSNIVQRGELGRMLDRAAIACDIVERGLAVLSEPERTLLDDMYMHRIAGGVERIREQLGLDDVRSVYKRVDRALYRFTVAVYGATEA